MSSIIRAEDEQSSKSPFPIMLLPEEVIIDIIARVPMCKYSTLVLVSKYFGPLVVSPELYVRRSLLGSAEHCLFVLLYNSYDFHRWYNLYRKSNGSYRLVHIPSFPALNGGKCVGVGSKIYVFGGISPENIALGAFSIDCRSDMVQTLPSMPIPNIWSIAGVIDGKIYVTGYYESDFQKILMKLYMRDHDDNSFVYDPKKSKWGTDEMMNSKKWKNACVVDDVLYYYDGEGKHLRMYDPTHKCWGVVNGLEELLLETRCFLRLVAAGNGGKLVLLFPNGPGPNIGRTVEIWCAEISISLERRQGEEIWGKIEWCGQVLGPDHFYSAAPLAVMV
ncbi:unnamed protein product [Microthlaspi erraticum]|uniref:F-box domain-containing protein n=1 Tax=Microthlaspi erraticum TaxID=1685480 RepID=A0A6D2JAM5_9BRAS|nr:unnamed protein product [Microthlaspi erraticum]